MAKRPDKKNPVASFQPVWREDRINESHIRLFATCGASQEYRARDGEIVDVRALGETTRVTVFGNNLVVHARGELARVVLIGNNIKVNQHGMDGFYLRVTVNGVPAHRYRPTAPVAISSTPRLRLPHNSLPFGEQMMLPPV